MHLPIPNYPPMTAPEPVAMVRNVSRGDVLWDRPIFKAPPLEPLLRNHQIEGATVPVAPVVEHGVRFADPAPDLLDLLEIGNCRSVEPFTS